MAPSKQGRRYTPDYLRDRALHVFTCIQLAVMNGIERKEGQAVTEYAMLIAFLAVLAISAARFLSGRVSSALTTVANSI
jgi:Flp pilus assembly pilin Flp